MPLTFTNDLSSVIAWISQSRPARLSRDKRVVRLVRLFVLTVSAAYLAGALVLGLRQLEGLPWAAFPGAVGVGLVLYPISLLSQAAAWSLGMGRLRGRRSILEWSDFQIYARSHLLKRLPGGFWYVAERVAAYRDDGLSPSVPIMASTLEWLVLLATAAILFVGSGFTSDGVWVIELSGVTLCCGAVGWLVGQAIAGRVSREKTSPSNCAERWRVSLSYAAVAELYLLAFVVGGNILFGFVQAGGGSSFSLSQAINVWALVGGIGTIVGLLPAGLGARDATLAIILAGYLNQPAPVVIAILLRLLFVVGDLVWGSALIFVVRRLYLNPRTGT